MAKELRDDELQSQLLRTALQQILPTPGDKASEYCVICLNEIIEPCHVLPCKHHNFDYLCLITWLEVQTRCPLCNHDIEEVRYDFSDGNTEGKVYRVPAAINKSDNGNGVSTRSTSTPERRSISYAEQSARRYGDEVMRRRRSVYRNNLYSLHIGSNRRQPSISQYQELSPELFRRDSHLISRARMWLRRELRVFEFLITDSSSLHDGSPVRRCSKVDFLVEYIIAILKTLDTQGSEGQAEEMIQVYLGRPFTRLFLHELRAWLRSPCTSLSAWDRIVQYASDGALLAE